MNQTIKVSVIIPIYNVEQYLRRCLDSVINQTYRNLEIILINDGSTDDCELICNEYKEKDDRIVTISKENGGLSSARNAGLAIATGEYVTYIDSDDYVALDYIEVLLNLCIVYSADISQCCIVSGMEDSHLFSKKNTDETSYSGVDYLRNMYSIQDSECACCKMYKMSLWEGIEFPVGRIMEDVATVYKVIYKASKIVCTNKGLYYYYLSPNSIVRKNFDLFKLNSLLSYKERFSFFYEIGEIKLYERAQQQYNAVLLNWYYCVKKYYPKEKKILNQLKSEMNKTNYTVTHSDEIKSHVKILLLVGRVFPYLTGKILDTFLF